MADHFKIVFTSLDRGKWINTIANSAKQLPYTIQRDAIILCFTETISVYEIESIHIVTLACLIELLDKRGYVIRVEDIDYGIGEFLFNTLQFRKYWTDKENYVPAKTDTIFNLWRVIDAEKETHSQQIHDYLKRGLFKNKELSAVKNSLVEVYYNIFDHAQADGNAFSFIKFDTEKEKLHVAVCDFGKGIAATVRAKLPEIQDDGKAIKKAMEDKFTIGSQTHNRGMGLGNILSACAGDDVLRIVSNKGFLYAKSNFIHEREGNFDFPGTLIYYELTLSHFDDEEIMANFDI